MEQSSVVLCTPCPPAVAPWLPDAGECSRSGEPGGCLGRAALGRRRQFRGGAGLASAAGGAVGPAVGCWWLWVPTLAVPAQGLALGPVTAASCLWRLLENVVFRYWERRSTSQHMPLSAAAALGTKPFGKPQQIRVWVGLCTFNRGSRGRDPLSSGLLLPGVVSVGLGGGRSRGRGAVSSVPAHLAAGERSRRALSPLGCCRCSLHRAGEKGFLGS